MTVSYVLSLKAYKITEHEGTGNGDERKTKSDNLEITIKDKTLKGLKAKVEGHMNLIDESEFTS